MEEAPRFKLLTLFNTVFTVYTIQTDLHCRNAIGMGWCTFEQNVLLDGWISGGGWYPLDCYDYLSIRDADNLNSHKIVPKVIPRSHKGASAISSKTFPSFMKIVFRWHAWHRQLIQFWNSYMSNNAWYVNLIILQWNCQWKIHFTSTTRKYFTYQVVI